MVKSIPVQQNVEVNAQNNKNPLAKFLPHAKYVQVQTKLYKKNLSQAIKSIPLDKNQVHSAVKAILNFNKTHSSTENLLQISSKQYIYIQIDCSKIPESFSVRPIQVALPVSLYSKQNKSRYTIISSEQGYQKLNQTCDGIDVPMLRQIISYNKLKKQYKQHADKKQLLNANDLFFCDWKIYNLLRGVLGKMFYEQKKYPFPIDCDGQVPENLKQEYKTYQEYINGLANSTYTMLGNGPVYTLKVGRTTMNQRDLVKNIMHGSYGFIAHILGNKISPQSIRQISIKTYNSPSLPIYCHLTAQQIKAYKK